MIRDLARAYSEDNRIMHHVCACQASCLSFITNMLSLQVIEIPLTLLNNEPLMHETSVSLL